jgi:hemolysin activation/secretion protein
VRGFFSIDNTGSQQTGIWRGSAGANWGNAFWEGGQLSYQYSAPFEYPSAQPVQSLSYSTPLPWKHLFSVYGSYSSTDTGISTSTGNLTYSGHQAQVSPRYTIPIGKMYGKLIQNFTLGADWKSSNLYFIQGGDQIPSNLTDVIQAVFGYQAQLKDPYGVSAFSSDFYWAPGNVDSRNTTQAFQDVDPRTQANYLYTTLRVRRDTTLPWGCSLVALGTGQLASHTLPSTEQLSIGGYGTVRGYQQQILFGDQGFFFNLELRSPGFSLFGLAKHSENALCDELSNDLKKLGKDQLQFLAFWDYGYVNTIQPLPGNASSYAITGVGAGIRYSIATNYTLRCDMGFPLINPNIGIPIGPTLALGASVSF